MHSTASSTPCDPVTSAGPVSRMPPVSSLAGAGRTRSDLRRGGWTALLAVATARDTVVVLRAEGTRDWLAAGVDPVSPATVAREQGHASLLALDASGESASTLAPGLFTVRYSGGVPPHEHGTTTRWRTIRAVPGGPGGSFTLSVAPGQDRHRLQAWVGVTHGPAEVELIIDHRTVRTLLLPLDGGDTPYVVTTMPLNLVPPDAEVQLVVRSSVGGVIGFAGAALR